MLPLVYICSPYKGHTYLNTELAIRYAKYALSQGMIPIVPHLMLPQYLNDDDTAERAIGMYAGSEMMRQLCMELWVMGDVLSDGMRAEIAEAILMEMPVKFFSEEAVDKWRARE